MLHKNASKAYTKWKMALILPLIAFFLWSFNVKEVNHYKTINTENLSENYDALTTEEIDPVDMAILKIDNKEEKIDKSIDNEITMTIDKYTTDDELKKISNLFRDNYDVKVTFSDVKRNNSGAITSIHVDVEAKNANANFEEKDDEGIKTFQIYYNDETHQVKIGGSKSHAVHLSGKRGGNVFIMEVDDDDDGIIRKKVTRDGKVITLDVESSRDSTGVYHIKKGDGKHAFILRTDDDGDEEHEIELREIDEDEIEWIDDDDDGQRKFIIYSSDNDDDKGMIWISKDKKKMINSDHDVITIEGDDGFYFMDDDFEDALFFIDGKKSSHRDFEKLDKSKIKKIEVMHGDKAIEEYGKKAKDGVVKVTTKK